MTGPKNIRPTRLQGSKLQYSETQSEQSSLVGSGKKYLMSFKGVFESFKGASKTRMTFSEILPFYHY